METPGITTAELEVALGGLYTAPKDPEAPDFEESKVSPGEEVSNEAGSPGITVGEMQTLLGDLYTAPSLEEAA
ncbi:MAG TPA: hypothetical protein VHI31_01825 [Actinomycetota bacterium]|nr:hypothetical protein [Actinomycetota bacterium]